MAIFTLPEWNYLKLTDFLLTQMWCFQSCVYTEIWPFQIRFESRSYKVTHTFLGAAVPAIALKTAKANRLSFSPYLLNLIMYSWQIFAIFQSKMQGMY